MLTILLIIRVFGVRQEVLRMSQEKVLSESYLQRRLKAEAKIDY